MASAWDETVVGQAPAAVSAWDATPATAPAPQQAPAKDFDLRGDGYNRAMNYSGTDAVGGMVRGAASIGSTLIRPFESAQDNQSRRTSVDEGLTSLIGSDPQSMAYKTNKLLAEIAGTSGLGGLIAKGIGMIPGAAQALPTLLPAIESGGMSVNGAKGVYGVANRIAGGAVNGAATAGLVDPKDAKTGALIGAAMPPVVQGAAAVGSAVGDAASQRLAQQLRDFERNAPRNKAIQESLDAGYVIPPATVNPTFTNRVLESVSGKQATQQIASVKNADVTDSIVRNALGLADNAPLTKGALEDIRKSAGTAYSDVAALTPQAANDLEALKIARNESQGWFNAYNRSASPIDLAKAKAAGAQATQLETSLEQAAQDAGHPELIGALRDARKRIAQTYTVQRALNPATGTVDAKVFARLMQKGQPLSDGLDTVGQFASAFPSVAKRPEQIGSPDAHNMKALASMLGSVGGAASMGPIGAATGLVPFIAPPVARSFMFSNGAQQALVQQAPKAGNAAKLAAMLQNQALLERAMRTAPVTGAALTSP